MYKEDNCHSVCVEKLYYKNNRLCRVFNTLDLFPDQPIEMATKTAKIRLNRSFPLKAEWLKALLNNIYDAFSFFVIKHY